MGFTLVGGTAQVDLDKSRFDSVIQSFGNQLVGADVALFYYAGHGLQVRGTNYLVPVTANPVRETDVDFQLVDVSLVLRQMEGAGTKLNLVLLDACRNNPFGGRGLRSSDGGLAQMRAPEGTLLSYATQATKPRMFCTYDDRTTHAKAVANISFAVDYYRNEGRAMIEAAQDGNAHPPSSTGRRSELLVFAIIVAIIWPIVAVGVVGGYGFLVWMSQMILGPPGPPHQ